jgi:hypothetical protein
MRMLKDYRGKDLDVLLRTVPIDAFNRAWPMLNNGLV